MEQILLESVTAAGLSRHIVSLINHRAFDDDTNLTILKTVFDQNAMSKVFIKLLKGESIVHSIHL